MTDTNGLNRPDHDPTGPDEPAGGEELAAPLSGLLRNDPPPPPPAGYWERLPQNLEAEPVAADVAYPASRLPMGPPGAQAEVVPVRPAPPQSHTASPGRIKVLSVAAALLLLVGAAVGTQFLNSDDAATVETASVPTPDPARAFTPLAVGPPATAAPDSAQNCGSAPPPVVEGHLIDFDRSGIPELVAVTAVPRDVNDPTRGSFLPVYRVNDQCQWELLIRMETGVSPAGGTSAVMCAAANGGTRQLVALREFTAGGTTTLEILVRAIRGSDVIQYAHSTVKDGPALSSLPGLGPDGCALGHPDFPLQPSMAASTCGGEGFAVDLPLSWHAQIIGGDTCRSFDPMPFNECRECRDPSSVSLQGHPHPVGVVVVGPDAVEVSADFAGSELRQRSIDVREELGTEDPEGLDGAKNLRTYRVGLDDSDFPLIVNTTYPTAWETTGSGPTYDAFNADVAALIAGFRAERIPPTFSSVQPTPTSNPLAAAITPAPTPTVPGRPYRVLPHDSIAWIAQKFGLSEAELLAANPATSADQLLNREWINLPNSELTDGGDYVNSYEELLMLAFESFSTGRTFDWVFEDERNDADDASRTSVCFDRSFKQRVEADGSIVLPKIVPPAQGLNLEPAVSAAVDALLECVDVTSVEDAYIGAAISVVNLQGRRDFADFALGNQCFATRFSVDRQAEETRFISDLKHLYNAVALGALHPSDLESSAAGCAYALQLTKGLGDVESMCGSANDRRPIPLFASPRADAPVVVLLPADTCFRVPVAEFGDGTPGFRAAIASDAGTFGWLADTVPLSPPETE